MLGLIAYLLGTGAAAGLMTFLYGILVPIRNRGEFRSWRVWAVMLVLVGFAPYLWMAFATARWGAPMKPIVESTVHQLHFSEGLQYYRVWSIGKQKATVLAVANDRYSWGGRDRAIVRIYLVENEGRWEADSYQVLQSGVQNKDGIVLPPMW